MHMSRENIIHHAMILSSTIDCWYLLTLFFSLHIPPCRSGRERTVFRVCPRPNLMSLYDGPLCCRNRIRTSMWILCSWQVCSICCGIICSSNKDEKNGFELVRLQILLIEEMSVWIDLRSSHDVNVL